MKKSKRGNPAKRSGYDLEVTDAGYDCLHLRNLIRETIPVLANPGAYAVSEFGRLAESLRSAIARCDKVHPNRPITISHSASVELVNGSQETEP